MSKPERATRSGGDDETPSSGPNLVLIYSLMALGFLVAVGLAVLIVLPYYLHR